MSESVRVIPPFARSREVLFVRRASRPTAREWARHAALFLLTVLTTTLAGTMLAMTDMPEPSLPAPVTLPDYLLYLPAYYLTTLHAVTTHALAHPALIGQGALFSLALLAILTAHESGHYVASRLYGVDATLPFFIPAPPLFLVGTFGAFIKIKSPIPSRRALFDIGVAGPLAGFAVVVPVAALAMLTAQPAPPMPHAEPGTLIVFNDPLLLRLLARVLGVGDLMNIAPNSFYFAAWFGLLVTSLNLVPVGQLDGGHASFAIFGARAHKFIGRAAFLTMLVLAPLGWFWHGVPSGFLYVLLLFVMLRVSHPQPGNMRELGTTRLVVALLTLMVFLLSFMPFPITII